MFAPPILVVSVCAVLVAAAPAGNKIEYYLDTFLELYYDAHVANTEYVVGRDETSPPPRDGIDGDEMMQSDQPSDTNSLGGGRFRINTTRYLTDDEYIRESRARDKGQDDGRAREEWVNQLKISIMNKVGRTSSNVGQGIPPLPTPINITHVIQRFQNGTPNYTVDNTITEKLRSFYPTCEIPKNAEHDVKKDENTMNLYANLDQLIGNVSSATLRLYRTTAQNGTEGLPHDAERHEDEKLYRVTIYFYTKSRKHRGVISVKKKMSDCKMVSDQSKWAEMDVKPAVKAWSKGGKNMGLAVQVEDQEGKTVKADSFFRGCMIGSSTPKPIPSILFDSGDQHDPPMLPTIDICTIELPENYTRPPNSTHTPTCTLLRTQARASPTPSLVLPLAAHIRHQRQHLANKGRQRSGIDPRSHFTQHQVLYTNEELQNLAMNSTKR